METIYFYAPDALRQENILADHSQWTGFHSNFTPWIAQTYFHLSKAGWPCEIATQIPEQGILIADRDTLDNDYPFLEQVMLICVKSDAEYHPSAHLHVIYNPADLKLSLWHPYRIDHWPMPGLIPRDTQRGNLVANISYIGTRSQLAAELKSSQWLEALGSLNLHWQPVLDSSEWHNYQDIDVIIAARDFQNKTYNNKGSIKLINAWLAGVPALLTPESGFLAQRKSDVDFLLIRSLEEAISSLNILKTSPELYAAIVKNGLQRAQEFSVNKILAQWQRFFHNFAFPH